MRTKNKDNEKKTINVAVICHGVHSQQNESVYTKYTLCTVSDKGRMYQTCTVFRKFLNTPIPQAEQKTILGAVEHAFIHYECNERYDIKKMTIYTTCDIVPGQPTTKEILSLVAGIECVFANIATIKNYLK